MTLDIVEMQEVNNLCTDSGLLRANTVLFHFTQYSLLVCYEADLSLYIFMES